MITMDPKEAILCYVKANLPDCVSVDEVNVADDANIWVVEHEGRSFTIEPLICNTMGFDFESGQEVAEVTFLLGYQPEIKRAYYHVVDRPEIKNTAKRHIFGEYRALMFCREKDLVIGFTESRGEYIVTHPRYRDVYGMGPSLSDAVNGFCDSCKAKTIDMMKQFQGEGKFKN